MDRKMFTGVGVAMITPFTPDGQFVDRDALAWLVDFLIMHGVNFLVPCGTTGESPTLSHDEHEEVVALVIDQAKGRVPILAGTGSNNTAEAVRLTEKAKRDGANGVLVVSPYYNKPMPNGVEDYYRQVAQVGLPVFLYDIPSRTGKGVPTDLIKKLAREGVIAGLKWASGDLAQLMSILEDATEDFTLLSGDDNLTLPAMSLGAQGVISVAANLVPDKVVDMCNFAFMDSFVLAKIAHYNLLPLFRALFIETNPIPIKKALKLFIPDVFSETVRSPLSLMEEKNVEVLVEAMSKVL